MVGLPLMSPVHILSKGYCPWTAEGHERTCERIRRSHEKDHVRSVPWGWTEYSVQYNTVRSLLDEKNAPSSEFDRILCQLSIRKSSDVLCRHERSSFRLMSSQGQAKIYFAVFTCKRVEFYWYPAWLFIVISFHLWMMATFVFFTRFPGFWNWVLRPL